MLECSFIEVLCTGALAGDDYGAAVAVHAGGHVAAVGAPERDTSFASSGAVFMFKVRRKPNMTITSGILVPWLTSRASICLAADPCSGKAGLGCVWAC